MREHQWYLPSLIFLGLMATVLAPIVQAQERCTPWLAKAYAVEGWVEMRQSGEAAWRQVNADDAFCRGDQLRTLENSRATLELNNQTHLRLDQHTTLSLTGPAEEPASLLGLIRGAIHFIARIPKRLKVTTPFVNASVEGTEFLVQAETNQSLVVVYEGHVLTENPNGQLRLKNGEAALAEKGKAPRRYLLVQPRDAVEWALYYPPIIEPKAGEFPRLPEVQRSIALYRDGKPAEALALIKSLPQSLREPRLFIYRAGLYLYVGRVEEARRDIQTTLALEPKNSDALALQSIIHLSQNNKAEAQRLAEQAVQLNPQSASAHLARSYAEQAHFQLPKARQSVKEALAINRDNALLWARLAELEMSEGKLADAQNAANQAVRLNPRLSRTQSVLGFAHLTRIETSAAKQSFEKAIASDPADPLPRLGLGLARIREGDLEEGRDEIELATILDPGNALVRSYMGKAYYEEKRDQLASSQFDMAKELDPKDPTPWFYDAIKKQTENRSVEALHDLEKAIELNDNRAVYRSKLLLDSDLAARSASLGRIYRDLGFEQLALVEGWKSVNTDPSDYSGHRLLADSYSALPRHEIARVSELLQSQLLQPINVTPVQPSLAESNLLILEGAGPSAQAFNEFNPLFTRNQLNLQTSAIVGSNNTFGDEVVHSGIWNNFSYSLGQFHYETEGFRPNNDLRHDIYDLFVQGDLYQNLSVQGEVRHRETEQGDLAMRFDLFDPRFFNRNLHLKDQVDTYRLGVHYAPAPHSDLIASTIYQDASRNLIINRGVIFETQYLFHKSHFDVAMGLGYYNLDGVKVSDFQHGNGYIYSHIGYPELLLWTLGISFDSVKENSLSGSNELNISKFNPKFGLMWNIAPATTLRLAAFKGLKRSLIASQTIEPTQIAGFNQFFDDFDGTVSTRYGIGLDQKFSLNIYGGFEISRRDLEVPVKANIINWQDWQEELYRAYLNWTPSSRWAASVAYEREHFENREPVGPEFGPESKFPRNTQTQFFPATLSYYDPSGFFSRLKITYVNQKLPELNERDEFVLTDVAFGYRLPKRYGLVSIEIQNLFDDGFRFQGVDRRMPTLGLVPPFLPERTIFANLTLAF